MRASRSLIHIVIATCLAGVYPSPSCARTLEESLALAYQSNPRLKAEQAKLRVADEQSAQAMSGWRPDIEAVGEAGKSYQKTRDSLGNPVSANLSSRRAGVTITQPLFKGFRTVSAVRAAESSVMAQRALLIEAEQTLLFDVAKAHFDVATATDILKFTRENEDVLERQKGITQDRFRIGDLKKTDVAQAELRLSAATASRLAAEGDLANKRFAYLRLVGEEAKDIVAPALSYEIPKTLEELLRRAEKDNPSLQASDHGVARAKAETDGVKGSLLPEVNLVGNVDRAWAQSIGYPDRQDTASVMVRMTVPLYRAGTDYSKTRAAAQTETQQEMARADMRRNIIDEAMIGWQSLATARSSILARQTEIKAATMALDGVKQESRMGTRTTLDVLNAEQEALNARISLARAQNDEAVALFRVLASMGALTARGLGLHVDFYDAQENHDAVRDKWIGF